MNLLPRMRDVSDFMTLEEAMRSDDITVSEQVYDGPEGTLIAANNSEEETIFYDGRRDYDGRKPGPCIGPGYYP